MGKKSQKLRASETQKSDQAKKKEVEALAAKKAAEEKAAEEKRLAEEKAAEQKRQAEAEAKRVAIESKREQPPFSCRIKSGNAGVLEVCMMQMLGINSAISIFRSKSLCIAALRAAALIFNQMKPNFIWTLSRAAKNIF
jgi:hypothetical protein